MAKQTSEPGLAEVAERAGVSLTTVSRVLNNRGYLSQQTRDRVAQAIDELGYRPNQVARSLLGQRTRMVGVIMPTVAWPFFGEVAAEVEHALADRGYRALLCNSLGRAEAEREYLDQLRGQRVDGVISGAHNNSIPEYASTRLPVVTIDRQLAPHIPNVRCDNYAGGRLATEHLLARGARRPALFTSTASERNLRERGYRDVLTEAGVAPAVVEVDFHLAERDRSRRVEQQLTAISGEIDAVFATDDLMAGTVLGWAYRKGLRVPDDLRVIGFDGTDAARRGMPWLSTVQQPIRDLCRTAVELLLDRIEQPVPEAREAVPAVEFPVRLIQGSTS